jgi:hypothetical protein
LPGLRTANGITDNAASIRQPLRPFCESRQSISGSPSSAWRRPPWGCQSPSSASPSCSCWCASWPPCFSPKAFPKTARPSPKPSRCRPCWSCCWPLLSLFWTVAPLAGGLGLPGQVRQAAAHPGDDGPDPRPPRSPVCPGAFAFAQLLVVLSSWMLFADLPVAWASSRTTVSHYTVFSGYLDQGIMSAVFAALCWHLRDLVPGRFGPRIAIAVAVACPGQCVLCAGRPQRPAGRCRAAVAGHHVAAPQKVPHRRAVLPFLLVAPAVCQFTDDARTLDPRQDGGPGLLARQDTSTSSGVRLAFWRRPAR